MLALPGIMKEEKGGAFSASPFNGGRIKLIHLLLSI